MIRVNIVEVVEDIMDKSKINVFNSNHEPYWIVSTPDTNYEAIKSDVNVDVAIVGGGIVGITTAYLLKQRGIKVAVIEANKILKGTTGHTTAKITSQHNLIYDKLINRFGEERARQYADANEAAIHMIANLSKEKNIDCDFEWRSAFVYTQSDNYIENIQNEVEAAKKLGIKAFYQEKLSLPFEVKGAVRFDDQAQYHPRKYLLALAQAIPGDGSYIYENTRVVDIDDSDTLAVITANEKKIVAKHIIIASHYPCYDRLGLYFARMYAEKSYAIGITIQDKFPDGMYITAEDPGRSLRTQKFNGGELIIVGGEHHKTGHEKYTNVHYENLSNFAQQNFNVSEILYRWSTQDCMTLDGVPYVGNLTSKTPNIFVATGFGKWGMTNGTASAMILTDLITKGESQWSDIYNPSRSNTLTSATHFISQNADVALNYIGGKITPTSSENETDINKGEAIIIRKDGERMGAYKDEMGNIHLVDITCTHLGCELVWNDGEKTWDCPCHGSRFNYDGAVVEGPAFKPLNKLGEGKNVPDPNIF
jgi:glycine/D-amino acid oxidase-like deaminating enzyme/nitrite reductase/ring-hydroxylating ferredoxin subunit